MDYTNIKCKRVIKLASMRLEILKTYKHCVCKVYAFPAPVCTGCPKSSVPTVTVEVDGPVIRN